VLVDIDLEIQRGEVVVVLGGAPPPAPPDDAQVAEAVAAHLAAGDTPRSAAQSVAQELGVPRRLAYQLALAVRDGGLPDAALRDGDQPGGDRRPERGR